MIDLTLVIPTYQRPNELKRKLYHLFLQKCSSQVIIIDSSTGIKLKKNYLTIKEYKKKLKIIYYKVSTNIHFSQKLYKGSKYSKTKYTVMTFDDDYLNLVAVKKGKSFLEQNSGYTNASGHILNHIRGKRKQPSRLPILGKSDIFNDDHPISRCENFLNSKRKRNPLFNLWETKLLQKMLEPLSKTRWTKYSETLFDYVAVASGKSKFIDDIYEVRTVDYNKKEYRSHGLEGFKTLFENDLNDKFFFEIYHKMIEMAVEFICKQSSINKIEAKKKISNLYFRLRSENQSEAYLKERMKGKLDFLEFLDKVKMFFYRIRYLRSFTSYKNFLIFLDVIRNYHYSEVGRILNYDPKFNFCYYSLKSGISPFSKSYEHINRSLEKFPN